MAAQFQSTLLTIGPVLRERSVLIRDLDLADSGAASDAAKSALAQIELVIGDADREFQGGGYGAALRGYQKARALIYRLLHPSFDVDLWLADRFTVALPTSVKVEKDLLQAGVDLIGALRPTAIETATLPVLSTVAVEPDLVRFTRAGFRREISGDAVLEVAGRQAVSLMTEGRPEQAVPILEAALGNAAGAGAVAQASSRLNLAVALLQSGAVDRGREVAAKAAEGFQSADDQVGLAQALHAQAVGARTAGDQQAADDLFTRASAALGVDEVALNPQPLPPVERPVTRLGRTVSRRGGVRVADLVAENAPAAIDRAALVQNAFVGLNGRDASVTAAIRSRDAGSLAVRVPGQVDGWQVVSVPDRVEREVAGAAWRVGIPVGDGIGEMVVSADVTPAAGILTSELFDRRAAMTTIADLSLVSVDAASTSSYLNHLYGFALLVKIGDAQHELGQFAQAEATFAEAAEYRFLNTTLEATALWIRLARNAVEWGGDRYRAQDFDGAKAQYGKLVAEDSTVPASSLLYDTAALASPADQARDLVAHLVDRPLPDIQWEIAGEILTALSYLQQLADGLDFYGLALSPIHTFEYLQSVARAFAQQAISAEREYVTFRSRQQVDAGTRRDLVSASAMAHAEASARGEQARSGAADVAAAQAALAGAVRRRDDAITQRDAYAAASWTQIWSSAAATALGMGSDAYFNEISELADKLDRGETIHDERGKVAAAETLLGGRRNRDYELAKMADNIAELNASIPVAEAQLRSAQHAAQAAEIAWQAALQRAQYADAALAAFDGNEFTPAAWSSMADVMRSISRGYLWQAIRLAKLMERAYNFETDSELAVVKDEYGFAVANATGADAVLLGGDSLAADVESFTYLAITSARRKQSRIKDVISLARDFPLHFQEFRRTGRLSFETDLYEFDRLHPGFHQQRIEAVEVEFVGLVPEEGLNGTLAAGGATRFRTRTGEVGRRVHQIDTMALSDFVLRNDSFVYSAETGVRGLFQGLGVGATWELLLPRRSNDFDFARIADVHLVVYYTAAFDVGLRTGVLTRAPRPGELSAVRDFTLRYDAPDAWYGFYRDRAVDFVLDAVRMPANQTDFAVETVQLRVQTRPGLDPVGIDLAVTAPGQAPVTVTTGAGGAVDLTAAAAGLVGKSPLGTWHLALADATPADQIVTLQLGLEYGFAYPDEEV